MIAAKNILRYLKGSSNYGIFYPKHNLGILTTYSNANWVGDLDTRKSISGILYKFGSSPIAWFNKLQPTLALSSIEVEYRVISEAALNITYLRRLFSKMGLEQSEPTPILCDNINNIRLAQNPIMHAQTKHIATQHPHIREKLDNGTINV